MMTPSIFDLWLTFLTALLASGHCIGMCGGMVAAYSLKLPKNSGISLFMPHMLYGLGRVSTYILLGALSGWVGSLGYTFGRPENLQGVPYLVAGGVMVWMGLDSAGLLPFVRRENKGGGGIIAVLAKRLMQGYLPGKTLFLGIITGFLPCALHWAFQAKAIAVGSVSGGMAILLAFGLGTLPALWGFGLVSTLLSQKLRNKLLRGAGLIIVFMGLMTIKRGFF
ncbi:MAG: sulfite exporter TauE/SafE family protein [Magnetococcales bacterium]|nr:sulfite exporter TauE/SafE family protein [Magnetococcales bacterium]